MDITDGKMVQLHGRGEELATLERTLGEVEGGSARFVLVQGEAGMGKTVLVDTFLEGVRKKPGHVVLESAWLTPHNAEPYLPFKEIMQQLPGSSKGSSPGLFPLPADGVSEAPMSLLGLKASDEGTGEPTGDRGDDGRLLALGRNMLFEEVTGRMLELERDNVVVLFFNNMHWMPNASLDLLQFMFQGMLNRRLMVIGLVRTEDMIKISPDSDNLVRFFNGIWREGRGARIELGPLEADGIREMVSRYLTLDDVPETAVENLQKTTGGHPLFLMEILEAVRENPKMWEEINAPSGMGVLHLTVPKSLGDLLASKVSRLSEEEKKVLYSISVLGRNFDFELIREMTEIDEEELVDRLDSLLDAELIVEIEGEEERYRFKRQIAQDVVYSSLSKARRRILHRKAGKALQKTAERGNEDVFVLAEHFFKGHMHQEAFEYARAAGDRAAAFFAAKEAVKYYDMALASIDEADIPNKESQRLDLMVKKGRNCDTAGLWDMAIDTFEKAIGLAKDTGDVTLAIDLQREIGLILMHKSRWDEALQSYETALTMARDKGDVAGIAHAAYGLATVYYKKGEYPTAVEGYRGCVEMVSEAGGVESRGDLAKFTRMLGAAYYRMGELDQAQGCLEKSLDLYTELGSDFEVGVTTHRLGMLANRRGEYERAIAHFNDALELFEKVGNVFEMSKNYINLGEAYFNSGNTKMAIENYRKAERIDRRIGNNYGLAIALGLQGRVHLSLREYDEAEELFEKNKAICEELGNRYGLAMVHRDLGRLSYLRGDPKRAEELLRSSLQTLWSIQSGEADETEALLGVVMERAGSPEASDILKKYEDTRVLEGARRKLEG